jgi:hypothetical protein
MRMSCEPSWAETEVPEPVAPVKTSVQFHVPAPRPGTSEKLADKVAAPSAATRPITTPSLNAPAQYGYSFPFTGAGLPEGRK